MEITMSKEEIKNRIEELREQQGKIAKEIYELERQNEAYWMGVADYEYSSTYIRLGWTTEAKANETMSEYSSNNYDCNDWRIEEISKEYNEKLYHAYKIQEILSLMGGGYNKSFDIYKDFSKSLSDDLKKLKKELNLAPCSYIEE